jgi:uncharacterized membrane protein
MVAAASDGGPAGRRRDERRAVIVVRRARRSPASSGVQLAAMAAAGVVSGLAAGSLIAPLLGPLVGWDAAAVCYLISAWATMWPRDAADTARLAVREDPNRPLRDTMLLAACLASLLGIAVVLRDTGAEHGLGRRGQVGLELFSVLVSWAVLHTVHTARYARIYYTGTDGGVNFNQPYPPRYRDFAYLAFTVGMTFQVSDTNVTDAAVRVVVLRHALLSYLFSAVIIGATINLLTSLAH